MTLTSTGGTEQTLTTFDEVWLEAGSVATRLNGLGVTQRNWRVLSVQIAGTNVVNRGQQHLVPTPDAVWKIVVLLYDLKVAPVDALFGTNVHGTVDLKFPDGTVQTESIDAASPTLGFASLPRGNYELRLHTAGLGAPTPVALSRDQTASIRVITFVDLGILGSVMLAGVASLLWIGRRQQIFASAGWIRARAGVWSSGAARSMSPHPVGSNRPRQAGLAGQLRCRRPDRCARLRAASFLAPEHATSAGPSPRPHRHRMGDAHPDRDQGVVDNGGEGADLRPPAGRAGSGDGGCASYRGWSARAVDRRWDPGSRCGATLHHPPQGSAVAAGTACRTARAFARDAPWD